MLHFTPEPQSAHFYIQSYEPGSIIINQQTFHHSVIIFKNTCLVWEVNNFQDLTREHLQTLLNYPADVILLGTGAKQIFLPPTLQQEIQKQNRPLDIMSSKMAALTYNLLAQESRDPLLALMIN